MTPPAPGLIRPYGKGLAAMQRLIDLGIIAGGLWAVHRLYGHPWTAAYSLAASLAVIYFYLFAEALGLYRSWRTHPLRAELTRLLTVWVLAAGALVLTAVAAKSAQHYSRLTFATWFFAIAGILGLWRILWRQTLRYLRRQGRNTRTGVIAGATPMARVLARTLIESPWMAVDLRGVYDDDLPSDGDLPLAWLGDLDALVEAACSGGLDIVYIAFADSGDVRASRLIDRLADTTVSVYVIPSLFLFELAHARWTQVGELPAVSIYETPLLGANGLLKRVEDICIASLGLVLAAVPMLLIALAVKFSSPGPVWFRQRRWGVDGREFVIYKFRTLRVCEDGPQVRQVVPGDPRLTPLGAFLRRTSLDELPQLFNVLEGSMSLVGPRPHASAHNLRFRSQVQGYMQRHKVRPGITGWAQIHGYRGELTGPGDLQRRTEHDLWYIYNWSLWLDLKIILLTLLRVPGDRHAY